MYISLDDVILSVMIFLSSITRKLYVLLQVDRICPSCLSFSIHCVQVRLEVMGKKAKNATYLSGNEAGKISREIAKVEKRRTVKSTLCNERSSRSHCMMGCNELLAPVTLMFLKDTTVY